MPTRESESEINVCHFLFANLSAVRKNFRVHLFQTQVANAFKGATEGPCRLLQGHPPSELPLVVGITFRFRARVWVRVRVNIKVRFRKIRLVSQGLKNIILLSQANSVKKVFLISVLICTKFN